MDLYRFFHPHHNPRLRNTPLRLQELGELEQAARELGRALHRAEVRTDVAPVGKMNKEHLAEIRVALDYVVESLSILVHAHPGDDVEMVMHMAEERQDSPGWETWSKVVRQRLQSCAFELEIESNNGEVTPSIVAPQNGVV